MPMQIDDCIRMIEAIEAPSENNQPSTLIEEGEKKPLTEEQIANLEFGISLKKINALDKHPTSTLLALLGHVIQLVESDIQRFYPEHRIAYCCIQLQLNKRFFAKESGVQSPAFRPRLKLQRYPKGAEQDLSNDTQVIDMHFIHCKLSLNKNRKPFGRGDVRKAFAGDVLDFDAAFRIARLSGKTHIKLEKLGLDKDSLMQFQLVSICSKKTKDAVRDTKEKRFKSLVRLSTQAANFPRIDGQQDVWSLLLSAEFAIKRLGLDVTPKYLEMMIRIMDGLSGQRVDKLKQKLASAKKYI